VARTVPAVVLALLVLTSIVPATAVAATPAFAPATGSASLHDDAPTRTVSTAASPTIRVDTALSLTPGDPGSVGVVQTFELPSEVTELTVRLESRATVTGSEGFTKAGEGSWSWDGETTSPTLTYRLEANRTSDASGPLSTDGSYLYADPGPWALVRTPSIGLQWRYRGDDAVSVSRETRVDGEGAVGSNTAFLGAHTVYTREAHGQTLRLVVPGAAEMADSPDRVLTALANASGELQVGDRDPTVFAVAAPTGRVDWAVQGLQVGSQDFWVRDGERVDGVGNAWLHEYVHTRQSFETADSGRWVTEASATWYAALLSLGEGATFTEFRQFLDRGTSSPQANAVLSDPGTWRSNAQYWKGALVLGELDRRIRLASNRSASLQTVFRSLNGHSTVTNADVLAAVERTGGAEVGQAADRFTTTSDAPESWERSAHREAFGSRPARMQVSFDSRRDVSYAGPYRTGTVETPVTVAVGERLAFRAELTNIGDASGDYEVVLRVADEAVAEANGTLAPSESATAELGYRFAEPGSYTVSVAGERVEVRVRDPATPTVTVLELDRATVERNGTVTATATVENTASVPGNRTVVFTRNGEAVAERTVSLRPGERTTVSATVTLPEAGEHRISAGDRSVAVRVTTETEGLPSDVPVLGFGVPVAVAAVALLAGLGRLVSAA